MKRLILPIFAMLFITTIPSSCVLLEAMAEEAEPPLFSFEFINKCDQVVTILEGFWLEPTDLLHPSFFRYWQDDFQTVLSSDSTIMPGFYKGVYKDRTRQLLIIKQSTIDKYGRDSILKNDIYDKRYVITYPEVTAGLKIVYTGD